MSGAFISSVLYRRPREAAAWLAHAFGFETTMFVDSDDDDANRIHIEMDFAGSRLMVGGEWADWTRSPASLAGANSQTLHVMLAGGIDAHCDHARAAGADVFQPPADQFYGDRTYRCRDLEGHVWTFHQPISPKP